MQVTAASDLEIAERIQLKNKLRGHGLDLHPNAYKD